MRKLLALTFLTLDGVMASPETWAFPYLDGQLAAAVGTVLSGADTTLIGRISYQEGAGFRPSYVVSTTLKTGVPVLRDAAEIAALKARPGRDIAVLGGGRLIRTLLAHDLLDELHLLVHPVLAGTGTRLFEPGDTAAKSLEARMVRTFGTGVVHTCYEPATG